MKGAPRRKLPCASVSRVAWYHDPGANFVRLPSGCLVVALGTEIEFFVEGEGTFTTDHCGGSEPRKVEISDSCEV